MKQLQTAALVSQERQQQVIYWYLQSGSNLTTQSCLMHPDGLQLFLWHSSFVVFNVLTLRPDLNLNQGQLWHQETTMTQRNRKRGRGFRGQSEIRVKGRAEETLQPWEQKTCQTNMMHSRTDRCEHMKHGTGGLKLCSCDCLSEPLHIRWNYFSVWRNVAKRELERRDSVRKTTPLQLIPTAASGQLVPNTSQLRRTLNVWLNSRLKRDTVRYSHHHHQASSGAAAAHQFTSLAQCTSWVCCYGGEDLLPVRCSDTVLVMMMETLKWFKLKKKQNVEKPEKVWLVGSRGRRRFVSVPSCLELQSEWLNSKPTHEDRASNDTVLSSLSERSFLNVFSAPAPRFLLHDLCAAWRLFKGHMSSCRQWASFWHFNAAHEEIVLQTLLWLIWG